MTSKNQLIGAGHESNSYVRGFKREKMTVAVILPVYNGEKYICEAIESIIRQSRKPDEIIIVDDGSKDNSVELIKKNYPTLSAIYLSKSNGGQSAARNFGVNHSSSNCIAFLDQDDIWLNDHLEKLMSPFETSRDLNVAVSYGNLDRIDDKGRLIEKLFLRNFKTPHPKMSLNDCLAHDMFIVPSAAIVCRKSFINIGGFDERLSGYEDDDLFLRMFLNGCEFRFLDEAVTKWRVYSSSTSHSINMANSRMIYFNKLVELFPDEPALNCFWTRDVIVPRFIGALYGQMFIASNLSDKSAMKTFWRDVKKILPLAESTATFKARRGVIIMDILLLVANPNIIRKWLTNYMW